MGYRGRGPRFVRAPVPVKEGSEYEVSITDMSRRGDSGVARIQGFVIFVPGTKVGDHVKVRITKVGRTYAVGEVIK